VHMPAEIGKTGRGHQPDIARADHADVHTSPLCFCRRLLAIYRSKLLTAVNAVPGKMPCHICVSALEQ
jgi:hypothetical protein